MSSPLVFGWNPTDEDLVRIWLAFNELRARKKVFVGFDDRCTVAAHRYWDTSGWPSNEKALKRMVADPFDFMVGFNCGLDIVNASHGCVRPEGLPDLLRQQVGQTVDELSGSSRIDAEIARLLRRRESQHRRVEEVGVMKRQRSHVYETGSASLTNLFTAYRIANGKVAVDHSILGLKFGERPEVLIEDVREIRADGMLFGDVTFSNASRDVVTWKNVFRPEHVKRQAEQVIRSFQSASDSI